MKEILIYENIYPKNDEVLKYKGKPIPIPNEENLYNLYLLKDDSGNEIGFRWRKVTL